MSERIDPVTGKLIIDARCNHQKAEFSHNYATRVLARDHGLAVQYRSELSKMKPGVMMVTRGTTIGYEDLPLTRYTPTDCLDNSFDIPNGSLLLLVSCDKEARGYVQLSVPSERSKEGFPRFCYIDMLNCMVRVQDMSDNG